MVDIGMMYASFSRVLTSFAETLQAASEWVEVFACVDVFQKKNSTMTLGIAAFADQQQPKRGNSGRCRDGCGGSSAFLESRLGLS